MSWRGDETSSGTAGGLPGALLGNLLILVLYPLLGWVVWQGLGDGAVVAPLWPNAGLALAALLIGGPRLLPGLILGSVLLNWVVITAGRDDIGARDIAVMVLVALGVGLQAQFGLRLLRRRFGTPPALARPRDLLEAIVLAGPVSCLVSATVGALVYLTLGKGELVEAGGNWWTWWSGDVLGVLTLLPLLLFCPLRPAGALLWQGKPMPRMSPMALACVLLCLGTTIFAWSTVAHALRTRAGNDFVAQVEERMRVLDYRLASYASALDAGAGFVAGSRALSAEEWRSFLSQVRQGQGLPGLLGLGLVVPAKVEDLPALSERLSREAGRQIVVTPHAPDNFIVRFIEPRGKNGAALGFNAAGEPLRARAIAAAAATGHPVLTAPLVLVQQPEDELAGYLLFRAVYSAGKLPDTAAGRSAAAVAWAYAPLVPGPIFREMLAARPGDFSLDVKDMGPADPLAAVPHEEGGGRTIFASRVARDARPLTAMFQVSRPVSAFGRLWTVSFESTPQFEAQTHTTEPKLVLMLGLALTGLFGTLLTVLVGRTDLIQAQVEAKTRALATQEEHTRSIIDTAMVGILLLDQNGRVLALNRAAEPIFGYVPSEMLGRPLSDFVPIEIPVRGFLAGPPSLQGRRLRTLRRDGTEVFVEIQLNGWATDTGEVRATAIVRDVTIRQRAEMRLRAAEQRWNLALNGAHIAVFDIDVVAGTQVVSDTWYALMGITPEPGMTDALRRADWAARVHPEDLPFVMASEQDCIDGRIDRSVAEYRVRMADGSWRWMRSEAVVPERDAEGRGLRLLGVQSDVTALKRALEALRQSEAQFRSVIDLAPAGMALISAQGRLQRVNAALCLLSGRSNAELLQMSINEVLGDGGPVIPAEAQARLISGELRVLQLELPCIRPDASEAWVLVNVSAMEPGVASSRFIAQILDITERRQVEQFKSDFVATVSHELRTPLTSIKGALGLVLGQTAEALPGKAERLLGIALKNCDRLITLVNDILDLEKIASGKSSFTLVEADLATQIEQGVAINQPYAAEHGAVLRAVLPGDRIEVAIDLDRFQQVMANLLSNAAKFSPRGAEVTITFRREGERVRVSVIDQGPGVPEEFRPRIFRPFSQADSSDTRQKGGTGLGLNISRQIVERLGGTIGFDCPPGRGTEFWFTLPVLSTVEPLEPGIAPVSLPELAPPQACVLHVEDDHDFAEVVRSAFGGKVQLVNVSSKIDARRQIRRRRFDAVIVDWELPDGNGARLLELLDSAQPGVPVFGLSAQELVQPDPRVRANFVKSRTQLEDVVDTVLAALRRG